MSGVTAVIGLEVHVQLSTAGKLFCGDVNAPTDLPNTHVCPVCLGYPGALPVLDPAAVQLALRAALALRCTVAERIRFDRKCYFYPDLPKGYQITQQTHPLGVDGEFEFEGWRSREVASIPVRRIRILRVHLEEDTARSVHADDDTIALDFNRAGVPLIEIVTAPEFGSGAEARAFLADLRRALVDLGVSRCAMEEGGLRVDANVSLATQPRAGDPAGAVTEIKNLNSFQAVERSVQAELERQREVLASGGSVEPVTLSWDAASGVAKPVRGKAGSLAYRYHPEPDIPPLILPRQLVEDARAALPELPRARATRLATRYGITHDHARAIAAEPWSTAVFEYAVEAGARGHDAASWVLGEVSAARNARSWTVKTPSPEDGRRLAELIGLVADRTLSRPAACAVLLEMLESGASPVTIVRRDGLTRVGSGEELDRWVNGALSEDPAAAARLRAGENRLIDYFVGKVMRASRGRADPVAAADRVREIGGR